MRNFPKTLLSVFCTTVLIFGLTSPVSAKSSKESNILPKANLQFQSPSNPNLKFINLSKQLTSNDGRKIDTLKKQLTVTNNAITFTDLPSNKNSLMSISQTTTASTITDPYEPNNNSTQANTIQYGQTLSANLGDSADQDWYATTLTKGQVAAFLLKNIPTGCNYDLAIISPDFRVAKSQNISNANDSLYINIDMTGTWYVVVYNTDSTQYNANSNYSLFVGDAWANGSTGTIPTNMKFNFTQGNVNTILPYQVLDLSNYANIPDSAIVKSIFVGYSYVIGNYGNLTKYIGSSQNGAWYSTFTGLSEILYLPDGLYVKQPWAITGSVEDIIPPYSSATWSPSISITYKYVVE